MTIDQLKKLMDDGEFHHATYRDQGTIWEGLWIYAKQDNKFNGYTVVGSFEKGKLSDEAYALVRNTGVSVGAYGQG